MRIGKRERVGYKAVVLSTIVYFGLFFALDFSLRFLVDDHWTMGGLAGAVAALVSRRVMNDYIKAYHKARTDSLAR